MRVNRLKNRDFKLQSLNVLDSACIQLGMKPDTRTVCVKMLNDYAERQRYGSYSGSGLAAAALYLSSRMLFERTLGQKEVSEACCVAQVTLRSYVSKLRKRVNLNGILASYWSEVEEKVFGQSEYYGQLLVERARA